MKEITEFIQKQFDFNRNKNLFYAGTDSSINFVPELSSILKEIKSLNRSEDDKIINYSSEKALEEFCKTNQYYSFTNDDKQELKNIYSLLLLELKQTAVKDENQLQIISQNHSSRLKYWLLKTNSFSSKIYKQENKFVKDVTCSEYTAKLQMDLLNIELSELIQPVLDIGCGRQTHLVTYLREKGIEAYGIDRFKTQNKFCWQTDWLEFKYEENRWGTIISHLGFSNHFNHHHLRIDGNFKEYALIYMNILKSLKQGGSFVYTPDIPFIEKYLDSKLYNTTDALKIITK